MADPSPLPRVPVVGVGASAGGLEALRDMFGAVSSPTGMSFVVVQHLDPTHRSMLAELLGRHTALTVQQADGGEQLTADTVYIIPPGHGLAVRGGRLELTSFEQPRGLRRPIDDFLESLAEDQAGFAAGVILSGTGADGAIGMRAIKEHGGLCVVQEPESARYDGMPLAAVGTGLVDFVRQPDHIVSCLANFFARRGDPADAAQADVVAGHVDELCATLRTTIGHDFSGYKRTSLVRRIDRRMRVLGLTSASDYLARLKGDHDECSALFRDLLINVTRFFRDPQAFAVLRREVIEPLLRSRPPTDEVRIWVPGCSSGEEAYTLAMLCADVAHGLDNSPQVQIFATDIDEQMLGIAREGRYPVAALADIPAGMRERYTDLRGDTFTLVPALRNMIRFSGHSVIKDPPFSRIDLISCRNLLIYFDEKLQAQVMPLFHYALRPGGFLFLGPSESVTRHEQLFATVDQPARLYMRKQGLARYPVDLPDTNLRGGPSPVPGEPHQPGQSSDERAMRRLLDRYVPPSLVVDEDGTILAAYGKLGAYFDFPVSRGGGTNAMSLARPGLRQAIGALLRRDDAAPRSIARDIVVASHFGEQQLDVIADRLGNGTQLVVLREKGGFRAYAPDEDEDFVPGDDPLEVVEEELRATRHRLRTAVEELETANEELKSSNEELMSMNEELQSTNEELSTVNDELKSKIDQLAVANTDLRNFLESTDIAVVVVDRALAIRSFTRAATGIFPLKAEDRGRSLGDVTSTLRDAEYLADVRRVASGGEPVRRMVHDADEGRSFMMSILPYRTSLGQVEGATLMLRDMTDERTLASALSQERERLDIVISAAGIGIWDYYPDTGQTGLDAVTSDWFASEKQAQIGTVLDQIVEADRPAVAAALQAAADGGQDFEASFRLPAEDGEVRWIRGFGRMVRDSVPRRIVGVSIDCTAEHALVDARTIMLREMNHRVKNLFAVVAGMLSAAARSHSDVDALAADMRDRIAALGRAHTLASAEPSEGLTLRALLETTLAPYRAQAEMIIEGPELVAANHALSSLALIFHEWATNAVKYGAIAASSGLTIRWRKADDVVTLDWQEQTGTSGAIGEGSGFGTLLIATSARQLRATVEREAAPGRYALRLDMPAATFLGET